MGSSIAVAVVAFGHTNAQITSTLTKWASQTRTPDQAFVVANAPLENLNAIEAIATVLTPGTNLGFTGGANLAARAAAEAGATHLLLTNLDVEILSNELLAKLEAAFVGRPDATFVSPSVALWPDTSLVWYRGAHIARPIWVSRHPGINRPFHGPSQGVVRTGYFAGCCALIDLARFNELGGFDEGLFMYYDEAELSLRADAMGWHCYLVDEPLLAHEKDGRAFTPNESYWHARNSALLLNRFEHGPRRYVGKLGQWLMAPVQMTRCDSRAARKSYFAGLRGAPRPGVLPSGAKDPE